MPNTTKVVLFFFTTIIYSLFSFHSKAELNSILAANTTDYDSSRIFKALVKAQGGDDIVIGVLGGSITQGYAASTTNTRWANLVQDWWETKFPSINVTLVNAGIGGTGSDFGAHRVGKDLLAQNPDFVIVEFSVNDSYGAYAEKMMEGLVRNILSHQRHPGLMMLMLKQSNGTTAQLSHKPVGEHYKVPMISFADLIDNAVTNDSKTLSSIFVDGLHPNDDGMNYIANFIKDELEILYNALPVGYDTTSLNTTLPSPLIGDVFSHTYNYNFSSALTPIAPISNKGWYKSGNSWKADNPGDEISFKVDGNAISLLYEKHNVGSYGKIDYWIDNGTVKTLDSYWTQTWGPAKVFVLLEENLSDGDHIVHLKIRTDKSAASTGYTFKVLNLFKAGNITNALPIAFIPTDSTLILPGTINLDGSSSYDPDGTAIDSYAWTIVSKPINSAAALSSSSTSAITYTPEEYGDYEIGLEVTSNGLTSNIKKYKIKVRDNLNNTLHANKKSALNIFPNPSKNELFIRYNATKDEGLTIHLTTLEGKNIKTFNNLKSNLGENEYRLDLRTLHLKNGSYLLLMQSESNASSIEFIIQD